MSDDILNESSSKYSDYDSDNDNDIVTDCDTIDNDELNKLFNIEYKLIASELVKPTKSYILYGTNTTNNDKLSVGLSDKTIQIYDVNNSGLNKLLNNNYNVCNKMISGLKFDNDNNILYISALDGFVKLIDLRTLEIIATLNSTSDLANNAVKPIISFDINANNRILCCGTEKVKEDAFLIFYDIRQREILGTYSESHIDDITTVKFHPENSDKLATGATDGLINIFDISQENEDDALEYTLNTELSVNNINWHKNLINNDMLTCITHTNDLLLYDVNNINLIKTYKRNLIAKNVKRKSINDCYLINTHNYLDNKIMILTGSYNKTNECLRSLYINQNTNSLNEMSNYKLNEQIVRTSIFDDKTNTLITGGEKGLINIWKQININNMDAEQKYIKKIKSHKRINEKPY